MTPPFRALDWLDRLAFWPALGMGLTAGAALGAVAWIAGAPWGLVGAGLMGLLVGLVAWRGQAVAVWAGPFKDLLEMVEIRGGAFLMGSPEGEEGRSEDELQHEVRVSGFVIGRTVVTRKTYRELLGEAAGADDHPVNQVSWLDAVTFCNRLSAKAGLGPCYEIEGQTVRWVRDAGGYRLPTEAEWEYAARAGTTTRWSFGDDEMELGRFAWFGDNSGEESHPVATREPNPWGLYDVHGNVWEWCWDAYTSYEPSLQIDPRGPEATEDGVSRVVRGGAFDSDLQRLRSACRLRLRAGDRFRVVGFRCVRRSERLRAHR